MKYFIVLLLLNQFAFAQDINKLDANGKKHGVWKGIYEESKRPRYEGAFEHGKEKGMFKFFDDTKAGTIIATRNFSANDSSCYTIFYNQKKNKVSEGNVVNRQYEGDWKYYHEDSPQIMTLEHYVNGKLEGSKTVYYLSGKIAEETTYKNGIKDGKYKSYTEAGVVLEETIYKNGEYEGLAIFKNADDQLAGQGIFKNGKKVGMWKILEKGKLKEVNMNYQNIKFGKPNMPNQADVNIEIKPEEKIHDKDLEEELKNKLGR